MNCSSLRWSHSLSGGRQPLSVNMYPYLGFGLGLRQPHHAYVLAHKPAVDWFEVHTENFLVAGGQSLSQVLQIRGHYPLVMHGVALSIASADPLNFDYLAQVKTLMQRIEPIWISDHLCWSSVDGVHLHDLLPFPFTEQALQHVVARIEQVQDFLGTTILIENISSYIEYPDAELSEWEFLVEVAERSGCLILLDVNNVYVNSVNHRFDPQRYIAHIPADKVQQIHLAGHTNQGDFMIDTHDRPVAKPVWALYDDAISRLGVVSTMIERDDNLPEFSELFDELMHAKSIADKHLTSVQPKPTLNYARI